MTNLATVPVEEKAKFADPVIGRPADTSATSIERRSPARQASRGDKHRMPPAVIVHIVQASDLLLLLLQRLAGQSHADAAPLAALRWLTGSRDIRRQCRGYCLSLSCRCLPVALPLSAWQTAPDSAPAAAGWWR